MRTGRPGGGAGLLALAALALLGLPAGPAAAQSPYEEVAETSHNFLGATNLQEVCLSCHVASAGMPGDEQILLSNPLWGGGADLHGAFALEGPSPAGIGPEAADTSGVCLECHDGVLATAIHRQEGRPTLERGGSRPTDHPIRVVYPRDPGGAFVVPTPLPQNLQYWSIPDIRSGELRLPTGPMSAYQKLAGGDTADLTFAVVRSRDGRVACESCHNPHSDRYRPYLRNLPPDLCLVCHNK